LGYASNQALEPLDVHFQAIRGSNVLVNRFGSFLHKEALATGVSA
jgi:hypothetical protein